MALTPSDAPTNRSSQLRVVLADDNPTDAERTIASLRREFPNLRAVFLNDATTWKRTLDAGAFDLLITEYPLRWSSGLALAHDAKARWPDRPVIMVTATDSVATAMAVVKAGFDDYVPKNDLDRLGPAVSASLDQCRTARDRKTAEELRRSHSLLRAISDGTTDALFVKDLQGRYLLINAAGARILGRSVEEVLGKNDRAFFAPDTAQQIMDGDRRVMADGLTQTYEEVVTLADSTRTFLSTKGAYRDGQGAVIGLIGIARDITERTHAEVAIRLSEERYRELIENANDMVFTFDLAEQFTSINKAAQQITGYTREEALTMHLASVIVPEQLNAVRETFEHQLASGVTPTFELDLLRKDGERITVEVNARMVRKDGAPVAVQGIARDITERKRGEAEKAALFEIARDISGTLDQVELLARVQRRIAQVMPCDTVIAFSWREVDHTFRPVSHYGLVAEVAAELDGLVLPNDFVDTLQGHALLIADIRGQMWLPVGLREQLQITALIAAPLHMRDGQFGVLVAFGGRGRTFTTRQVELLEAIARQLAVGIESTELYAALQEEAQVSGALARVGKELIASLDMPVLLERLCRLTTEALGCDTSHTFIWQKDREVFATVAGFGDSTEQWEAIRVLTIPRATMEGLLFRLGEHDVVQVVLDEPSFALPGFQPTQFGVTASLFVALRRGGELIGVHTAGYRGYRAPFTEEQERIARGIGQLASVAVANAQLVAQLEQANRLKSDFVATMSHELRTPLHIIIGYHDLLLDGTFGALAPEQASRLQRADQSAHELLGLINATLDLSRLESGRLPLKLEETRLQDLLHEITSEVHERQPKPGVSFVSDIPASLPRVHTDPVKLKVAVKNVVANALKFTPKGEVGLNAQVRDGGIEINVADTGVGIAPEALMVIFEPFRQADSSSTRRYGGAGLGLYVARRLVDMLGGTITVNSEVDRGSIFHIWLPTNARDRGQRVESS